MNETPNDLRGDHSNDAPNLSGNLSGNLAGDMADKLTAALAAGVRDLLARPMPPGLYLVTTPIGNLGDVSPRMLVTLARADAVYCEDTRVSRPFLARFGITRRLFTYHEHSGEPAREDILGRLAGGQAIALISDAGMPAIADPGFKLVREVIAAGHPITVIPGPTALTTALAASGMPTDRFYFAGFLPPKTAARRQRIEALAHLSATLVFYESPHRTAAALADLAAVLGRRNAAIARELTKRYEELRRGTLEQLAAAFDAEPPRGEIAIVVGGKVATRHTTGAGYPFESEAMNACPGDDLGDGLGNTLEKDVGGNPAEEAAKTTSRAQDPAEVGDDPGAVSDATILAAARTALQRLPPAAAAKMLSKQLGVRRSRVYDLILFLKSEQKGS